ncbi:DUF4873 domain-containing protein [uncultured Jatrophihabitans sp.]|uniref:DUF4873 domain-containing protein n=1 Tax=uncultured Jatrophihabitans sp. TaxID=1610747 RepID=UPI0035C9EE5A
MTDDLGQDDDGYDGDDDDGYDGDGYDGDGYDGDGYDGDGYDGPAELLDGERVVAVEVTLRGHFDPISGKYSWYGRVTASADVAELVAGGARTLRLRTPHAEVATTLSDVDPWGRPRVAGLGATPFPVLDTVLDEG